MYAKKKKNLSKSLVRGPPSMFPQQAPYGERCSSSRANGLFIHLYLLESPKRSPPMKCGINIVTIHGSARGQKASISVGCGLVPPGDCSCS